MASEITTPLCKVSYEFLKRLEKGKRDELIKKIEEEERIEEDKLKNNPNLPLERKLQAVHDELKDLKTELDIIRNSLNINISKLDTFDSKMNCKLQCPYNYVNILSPLQQSKKNNEMYRSDKSHIQVYEDEDDDEYCNNFEWVSWIIGLSLLLIMIIDIIPTNKCIRPFTI